MERKNREKRLRLLVSRFNKERRKQAQKIDILCNDFIAGQKEFIKRLQMITFAANFYEAIIGIRDISELLHKAGELIRNQTSGNNVIFFLREGDNFEMHAFDNPQPDRDNSRLQSCFTPELVANICKANRICLLDDIFTMGLVGPAAMMNDLSAATIPLGQFTSCTGFVLVYCSSGNQLTVEELSAISGISSGLAQAIQSCKMLARLNN